MPGGDDAGMGACGADGLSLASALKPDDGPARRRRRHGGTSRLCTTGACCAPSTWSSYRFVNMHMRNGNHIHGEPGNDGKITDMDEAGIAQGVARRSRADEAPPNHGGIVAPTPVGDQGAVDEALAAAVPREAQDEGQHRVAGVCAQPAGPLRS
ncbi:hypothetical protein ZWY2020_017959 [Hordeum vulgare]|nr:hypothetical protein ZWY2020_017959 [Hordeum vulgare]